MKKFMLITAVIVVALYLIGCEYNKQIFDLNYSFERAIMYLPNGEVIDGRVQTWCDYEDGDQIQVKIDGVTYLVHSSNIALVHNGGDEGNG